MTFRILQKFGIGMTIGRRAEIKLESLRLYKTHAVICFKLSLGCGKLISAMRTAYFHPRRRSGESIETFGALFHFVALLLLFMLSFRLFLQAPLPVVVRHTKPCIVANVVDTAYIS